VRDLRIELEDDFTIVRRAYEAFTASDLAAFLAACREDIRILPMLGGVEGGYAGHRGVRAGGRRGTRPSTISRRFRIISNTSAMSSW
jgi:hypothetical protein